MRGEPDAGINKNYEHPSEVAEVTTSQEDISCLKPRGVALGNCKDGAEGRLVSSKRMVGCIGSHESLSAAGEERQTAKRVGVIFASCDNELRSGS